ncbi:MAG: c-type cytochrome [Actinobacteria bacterium]|nr:MAG: c-type cytochrome [Actinomycetota bacterium]
MRPLFAAAGGVALAIALAGCGTGGISKGAADQEHGKKLFLGKGQCAGCHTLAAAGSTGTIGPNLDDAFAQARADGYKESAIRNIVHEQIKYPGQYEVAQNNPSFLSANMPANLVRGQDAEDVAAFVAANAGVQGFAESQLISGTNGKLIFQKKCAGCHTLKDAGTTGTVGPNLDQLMPAFPIVQKQVTNGGVKMPAFKAVLTKAQIDAVAKYVAARAGK